MPEVFAGFVCGYALALLVAPFAAWVLLSSRASSPLAQRFVPEGTNVAALVAVLHLFGLILFTALGIVLGLALRGIEDRQPAGGLGSPTIVYTVLVVALVASATIPVLAFPSLRVAALVWAVAVAVTFGWAMPWLATLA